jgi:hypothetical protein
MDKMDKMDKMEELLSIIITTQRHINELNAYMNDKVRSIKSIQEELLANKLTSRNQEQLRSAKELYSKSDDSSKHKLEAEEIERINKNIFDTKSIINMTAEAIHKTYSELITGKAKEMFLSRLARDFPLKYKEWDAYTTDRIGGQKKRYTRHKKRRGKKTRKY